MPTLYHFSHDATIRRFEPRPSRLEEALVWAVDAAHAWSYCVPRDCPRACFWAGPATTREDIARFFGGDSSRIDMVLEDGWLAALQSASLWRYTLPDSSFVLLDAIAGHWVSREAVEPVALVEITDLPGEIRAAGVNLRGLPSIIEVWREVIGSTLEFSGTRLSFAHDYPDEWR